METITKADLGALIAAKVDIGRARAATAVTVVLDEIIGSLLRDEKVEIRGFGSFRVRVRESRRGRNPKTGESVMVPEKRIPYFKQGKILKEALLSDHKQKD